MPRVVSWFSCGAASAVATKLSSPDVIAYCDTRSEDSDNKRFLDDCEKWFGSSVLHLKNDKFVDTWDLWEKKKYLSGINGAPCTSELKIKPRLLFQRHDDIHVFGYTADFNDVKRADALRENWPELNIKTPLIEKGLTKAACLAMIISAGIKPPRVYEMGFPNANCIPCVKATSPSYWALVRKEFPVEFKRMSDMSRKFEVKLTRIGENRAFIDEISEDHETTKPIAPECDFLCAMAEQDLHLT